METCVEQESESKREGLVPVYRKHSNTDIYIFIYIHTVYISSILFSIRKKLIQVWNNLRVNYPFNTPIYLNQLFIFFLP